MHLDTNLALVNAGFQPGLTRSRSLHLLLNQLRKKETCTATRKKLAVPKYRSVSAILDFPPIPGRFNPHLSDERKRAMHNHLTQISDEYTRMELVEIRVLKAGALPEGSDRERATFLSSINKDYEALVKDEEDTSKDSSKES